MRKTKSQLKKEFNVENPLVSIIVPTYNRRDLLPRTIQSILNQTYKNIEIIVVNDCGIDVKDVLGNFHDPRIRYFSNNKNMGLGATRNHGLRESKGSVIGFLDDDDCYWPKHVEILVGELRSGNNKLVYSNALRMVYQKQEGGQLALVGRDLPYDVDYNHDLLLIQNITPVNTYLFYKSLLNGKIWFDENVRVYEDHLLLIELSQLTDFTHVKLVTCEYSWRMDGSTMSSSRDDFTTLLPEVYRRCRKYAKDKEWVEKIQDQMLSERGMTIDSNPLSVL